MARTFARLFETLVFRQSVGFTSRVRTIFYRLFGMKIGAGCRLENIRVRRPSQVEVGEANAFTEGCWLWPADADFDGIRISIRRQNPFNRDVMIDACNRVDIGSNNMFGPALSSPIRSHASPRTMGR